VVKFVFSHSKQRKQPFLLRFSKSWGSLAPCHLIPTTMQRGLRGHNMVNTHNPLTALLD